MVKDYIPLKVSHNWESTLMQISFGNVKLMIFSLNWIELMLSFLKEEIVSPKILRSIHFAIEHGQKIVCYFKIVIIFHFFIKNEITLQQKVEWAWNSNCHYILSLHKAWSFDFFFFFLQKSAYFMVTKGNMLFCLIGY